MEDKEITSIRLRLAVSTKCPPIFMVFLPDGLPSWAEDIIYHHVNLQYLPLHDDQVLHDLLDVYVVKSGQDRLKCVHNDIWCCSVHLLIAVSPRLEA
jgi:hypothetical protein